MLSNKSQNQGRVFFGEYGVLVPVLPSPWGRLEGVKYRIFLAGDYVGGGEPPTPFDYSSLPIRECFGNSIFDGAVICSQM
jgi:hypothetical protein